MSNKTELTGDYLVLRLDNDYAACRAALRYASILAHAEPNLSHDIRQQVLQYCKRDIAESNIAFEVLLEALDFHVLDTYPAARDIYYVTFDRDLSFNDRQRLLEQGIKPTITQLKHRYMLDISELQRAITV